MVDLRKSYHGLESNLFPLLMTQVKPWQRLNLSPRSPRHQTQAHIVRLTVRSVVSQRRVTVSRIGAH